MKVILTTIGRKSGEPRDVPLYAWEDGDRLIIVGSLGGAPRDPAWAGNLRADPRVTVRAGRTVRALRAREAEPGERDRLWELVVARFPQYETYRRRTKRRIPLFILEPEGSSDPSGS